MKDIIVGTWGIGPSNRRRVKLHIEEAIKSGYDNILPYIILTDQPEDFYELQDKTKKIVDIVNIHEIREKYSPWSIEYEYISKEQTEEKYAEDYIKHRDEGKRFSYGLHRFYLPRISELRYRKFLHCDADYWIRYDKITNGTIKENEFWDEFHTHPNTMKGSGYTIYNPDGLWTQAMISFQNIFRFEMMRRHPEFRDKLHYVFHQFILTEGPFRYYHFRISEDIFKYFLYWDEITEINLRDNELASHSSGASNMFLDYAIWMVVNEMLRIKTIDFPFGVYNLRTFWSDRYFDPTALQYTMEDGTTIHVKSGKTKKEFMEINKELIEKLMSSGKFFDQFPD